MDFVNIYKHSLGPKYAKLQSAKGCFRLMMATSCLSCEVPSPRLKLKPLPRHSKESGLLLAGDLATPAPCPLDFLSNTAVP